MRRSTIVIGLLGMVGGLSACTTATIRSTGPGITKSSLRTTTTTPAPPSTTTSPPPPTTTTAPIAPAPNAAAAPGPGTCQAQGSGLEVLPDPNCTPGATNPNVTQANIGQTICMTGWTDTVRPSERYTEQLKIQQMGAYGDTGSISNYEEDHLIPLELGGSPTDPKNLWPEPGATPNPKDAVEGAANHAVCDGQMTIAQAQQAIAQNWIAFGQQLGVSSTNAGSSSSTPTSTPPAAPSPAVEGATCSVSTAYDAHYNDYDVYVHSNQPNQQAQVMTSGGASASYGTDGSGYADVFLRAPESAAGQQVNVSVGGASCSTTLS